MITGRCPRRGVFCETCGITGVTLLLHEITTSVGVTCALSCRSCRFSGRTGPRTEAAARRMVAEHADHHRVGS